MRAEPLVLSVAGSDPGGGAGLQLDLKVFAALGADGAAVPAVLTVQGPDGLSRAEPVGADLVGEAVAAVFADGPVAAVKLGALGSAENVTAVAEILALHPDVPVVCDPVSAASVNARPGLCLLDAAGVMALRARLLRRVTVLTPNLAEAAALTGLLVADAGGMEAAAAALRALGPKAVLVKGGHLAAGPDAADLFFEQEPVWLTAPRIDGGERVHGTGCALSSALAVFLARGCAPAAAALRAREALHAWMLRARDRRLRPALG